MMEQGGGVVRPYLTANVFGSKGCGKTSFKTQWFDSSQARAISEIADVHIRIQKDCSYSVIDSIRNRAGIDGGRHHSFIIIYRPDNQESIEYGRGVLDKVYTTFDYTSQVSVTFIENHFEEAFKPHTEAPTEFPLQNDVLASRNPPQLWRVVLTDNVQSSAVLDSVITRPLLEILDTHAKTKLMEQACVEGRVQVLKLLAGTVNEVNSVLLISHTLNSLQQQLHLTTTTTTTTTTTPTTPPASPKHNRAKRLVEVASYLYYTNTTMVMSAIVRCTQQFPLATLLLLRTFCRQTTHDQHLVLVGVALVGVPKQWLAPPTVLTHVNLSNNLLTCIAEDLFQLATLQGLNLSHNCLEAIPSVLRWNCPKLRELDVSHNRLLSKPYAILEGRKKNEPPIDSNPPSIGKQKQVISAAQALLSLTGYNLYPCLCSITRVSISHNPALTQIPEWVCVLPSLTLLEMKGLPRLTRLTPHLASCRSLCILHLDISHLVSPPPDQAQKGTRNILTYLRCQLRGSTPYRHIKLVIVGGKGAGKSTLFRQFVRGSAHVDPTTSNMGVATFDYPSRLKVRKDRPRVTFHVIDFAGDEVYRSTHNCFLTYRSIYLCLWDTTGGKESLQALCPWLHSIQACVPGSPVLLVATHADRRPGLSASTILQWEEEVLGRPVQLKNKTLARRLGFPPIMQSVIMDCLNREDIDMLLGDLYRIALQMRHPQTNVLLMSDMLPRSYQELQTLVEVKVRNLCLERHVAPVLRHEELVDYVRSLTISNPNGLEQDQEEFSLACHFLHEVGAIVHFKSQVGGVSDLYFLDPQWLFNALACVVRACSQGDRRNATVSSGEWPHYFQQAGVPMSAYSSFLAMMEQFNIIVSLDFEKNSFLLPSLLPNTPPTNYPTYDLSSDLDEVIVQYIEMEYLPPPLFPQLIARIILYIRQLSGQLLSIITATAEDPGNVTETPTGTFLRPPQTRDSVASDISTLFRRSQSFRVDRLGYLSQDDITVAGNDDAERLRKIWGISTANFNCQTPDSRHRDLMQKLVAISQPIFQQQGSGCVTPDPTAAAAAATESSSHSDQFANYVVWSKGLFCEFPMCGTRFWLEACENAVAVVISGELVHRVKVLSFLTSSIDALLDECYLGLKVVSYSPCPSCLRQFWADADSARNFATSSLEQSCQGQVQINEFSESILYLHRRRPDEESDQSQRFGGSNFTLSMSPTPTPDSTHFAEMPRVALLEQSLTLFPLSTTVQQSVMSSSILCPHCELRVPLETISPDVLLVDFKHSLLLKAKHLHFNEDTNSVLGKGGFGKVFSGTYGGEAVAVKVFRKGYHEDVMLRRYKDLREELTIMSQLQHPRVVALVGVCLRPLAMVLKLAPLGSLRDHIDLCPHGMQSSVTHQVLYQIADGIRYLHSLYIVHRDIKPSNVLVWQLHPLHGVDVKLADYGISQFSSPSGLRRHKGTEEYMAPELFNNKRKMAYDEKVDVFSFGLVLHALVTGRKLFAGIINKREQLHLLYHNNDFPQISSALADSLADNKPLPTSPASKFPSLLQEGAGHHPAGRLDVISSCHSVCMQPLMESCLASNPRERPTAQGLCSWLLVCPGATAQRDYYVSAPVLAVSYSPTENLVAALQGDRLDHVTLFPPDTREMRRRPTPYGGQEFAFLTLIGSELFLACRDVRLLYSANLPSLQSGHISSTPLPGEPACLFSALSPSSSPSSSSSSSSSIVVGLTQGTVAIYSATSGGGHILETTPHVQKIVSHPEGQKKAVCCGLYHGNTLWCGCGTYLVGLSPKDLLTKHYKSIIQEGEAELMAASHDYVWVGFRQKSILVVCSTTKPNHRETLDCHSILGQPNMPSTDAMVTAIASGPNALWVGTKGGHLMAFNPVTADVLSLHHHKASSISFIICLSGKRLMTFGEGVLGDEEEEKTTCQVMGKFTVWENYIE